MPPEAPMRLFLQDTNDGHPNMDNRGGFFNPFKRLDTGRKPRFAPAKVPKTADFLPFPPLLTLWGTPRKKRLGVWFQALSHRLCYDVRGLDPNDVRDSTRLTRGVQSNGNRNCEVVQ